MATQLTTEQFIEILIDEEITKENDLAVFQAMFSFEEHRAQAGEVGRLLGNTSKNPASPINLQMARLAKRIARKHNVIFTLRGNNDPKYWDLFFNGSERGRYWVWQLKPNLVEALIDTELTGDIQYSEEIPSELSAKLFEGAKKTITVNAYERNSQARKKCISHWGAVCAICRFDFEKEYGAIGSNFIHVHHLTRISDIGELYEVDPIKDLCPVCPNCHSMLHKDKDALTIGELKDYYRKASARTKNYR